MGKKKMNLNRKNKTAKKDVVNEEPTDIEETNEDVSDDEYNEELECEDEVLNSEEFANEDEASNSEQSGSEDEGEKHKKYLQKLKEIDPEFQKFLEENDKDLLNFNLSDEENGDDEQEVHVPQIDDSDESDFEGEKSERKNNHITFKLLKQWEEDIKTDKTNKTIVVLSEAFHAALLLVLPADEENSSSTYKVEGSAIFNGVVQLCVLEFGPAVKRFLGSKEKPHLCKKFKKVKRTLKSYFEDLLKLLSGVASANIQTVLLKHLRYMSPMLISFPNVTKDLLKQIIKIWGVSEEGVRVVAFSCILKISRNNNSLLDGALKTMFITYVKNAKFVNPSSLPCINFMRRSLVVMFGLDKNLAYQHVFLYIRQLAIHLRNAMTLKKKEHLQAVYNWQFVNSLQLWESLLSDSCDKLQMRELITPFVQVCLGTLTLVPTAQYYPIRFKITQILINLSKSADVFIPVLPFIVDVLDNYDFNKKHQKVSMRPLKFTCILRLSKSQMLENGFKDALIDTIYDQLLEYMTIQSSSVAFPELSLFTKMQIKKFLKKCKNPNYVKKMKQALEKIEQNSEFIENERKKIQINLSDEQQVRAYENQIKVKGTPLSIYYESWSKLRNQKKRKEITMNDELGECDLPVSKKQKLNNKQIKDMQKDEDFVLSDSDDEQEFLKINSTNDDLDE